MIEIKELITSLDSATNPTQQFSSEHERMAATVSAVKYVLQDAVRRGINLPPRCLTSSPEKYARHLLHKAPDNSYSVVVMVWGPGQATPLHDHAGKWCVECVMSGTMCVTQFEQHPLGDGLCKFTKGDELFAGVGEAGHLIPPTEYHIMANKGDIPAVTIHAYDQELTECTVFVPVGDGAYKGEVRPSAYTSI